MDPLTAVGLVANIVQFVELGCKIFAIAKETRRSASGLTADDQRTSNMMTEMYRLSLHLESPGREPNDGNEQALFKLASECRRLANQILDLLRKTSAKTPGSKSEAIRSTVRKMRYAREKQELEQKLNTCRSQLLFHLNYVSSANIKEQLLSLASKAESQMNTIKTLDANLEGLEDTVSTLSLSNSDLLKQIRELVQLPQAAREAAAEQHILRSLNHDESHLRYEIVDKAHEDTFRWIIEEENPGVETAYLTKSRKLLRTWLSEEQGVFHVAGKLGSGKSTLMKFLFNHPNTVSDLRKWSGDRRLALVNFFFWRPGSTWQNSVKGLLQGLLHNTLQSYPELVRVAFPSIWKSTVASPGHALRHDETIETAFSNILKHASTKQTHRMCFFIDALDEQNDASPQNDHKALVDMIQRWVDSSQGTLKICVSSREDNVFTNAFRSDRRLRLQDLTRQDLEAYVRLRLPEIPSTETLERITQTIVERSDGIFLWVVLVVKALREAFEDGRELYDFEAELRSLPTELEALFAYLLKTVPIARQKNAYCLFKLMLCDHSAESMPLYAIMYLDKYLRNPRFAFAEDLYTSRAWKQSHSKAHLQEDPESLKARKMLQGDCRGLLESAFTTGPDAHFLTFTHRSVPEFLTKASTQKLMLAKTDGFSPGEALAQMFLGQLLAVDKSGVDLYPQYITLVPKYLYFVLFRYHDERIRQRDPTNRFLMVLERELERKRLAEPLSHTRGFYGSAVHHDPAVLLKEKIDSNLYTYVSQPYYLLAFYGDFDYVQWKLKQDPLLVTNKKNRSLLLAFMCSGLISWHRNWKNGPCFLHTVRQLLDMGPLDSPKYILVVLIPWLAHWQSDDHDKFMESKLFFAPVFAAVLSKIEQEKPTAITLDIGYKKADDMRHGQTDVEIFWDGELLDYVAYGGRERTPGDELSKALGGQGPFNLRDVIQLVEFDNGEEILGLLDGITGFGRVSSDADQAAVVSPTLTPEPDVSTQKKEKKEIGFATTELNSTTESRIATEDIINGPEVTGSKAQRGQPPPTSGPKIVYALFVLLGILCAALLSQGLP